MAKKKLDSNTIKKNIVQGFFVFIVVVFLAIAAFTVSLYMYTKEGRGAVAFPESPLTKIIDETHSYIGDDTLDIPIQCPSVPIILSVGGTERNVSEDGCVFRYNSDLSISIYEMEESAYELLSTDFASNLYNGEISGSAEYMADSESMDVGYFNGYPSEYQCGTINILSDDGFISKKIYVVLLLIDMGFEKSVMIAVSTSNVLSLYDAQNLLESIGYTVMDISLTKDALDTTVETQSDVNFFPNVTYEVESNVPEVGTGDIIIEVPIIRNHELGAVVVLSYTQLNADISRLRLSSDTYAGEMIADAQSYPGVAFFTIENAGKGNWELYVPVDMELGTYSIAVLEPVDCYMQYGFRSVFEDELPDELTDTSLEGQVAEVLTEE